MSAISQSVTWWSFVPEKFTPEQFVHAVADAGFKAVELVAWGVQVCRAVASPRVRLLYDIYHMQIMEGDITHTIRSAKDYIGHYHTAGNPGRNEMDEDQELYYPAILRTIKETGHSG